MIVSLQTAFDPLVVRAGYGHSAAAVSKVSGLNADKLLATTGLRSTPIRLALVKLLFGDGGRHLTAEMLYEEASAAKVRVSLASVYNTLNSLAGAGLLQRVCVDGSKTYFDTNVTGHQHFYSEDSHELIDIPDSEAIFSSLPDIPEDYEVDRIEVVVRIRKKRSQTI